MPTYFHLLSTLLVTVFSCTDNIETVEIKPLNKISGDLSNQIRGISLPQGFTYVDDNNKDYTNWLLDLNLKKSNTVYLYNGIPKSNQDAQYGVLDIDIGKRDLVQCADAAMKLRADFLFTQKKYDQIKFFATSGDEISFQAWLNGTRWKEKGNRLVSYNTNKEVTNIQTEFNSFMQLVFSYCGTFSLSKQLKVVNKIDSIQAGDIFIQGGFPGHAVTVMAVAKNEAGKKIFLLSQGYMPAQDIHILKNYENTELNPWYEVAELFPLNTPQWRFESGSLMKW